MNKKNSLLLLAILILVFCAGFIVKHELNSQNSNDRFDPLNATYTIEGQPVTLVNGKSETPLALGSSSNSASKIITQVFGKPTMGDINGDGKNDAVLILTQNQGGSGTFYYIVADINGGISGSNGVALASKFGTNAILLGDRIIPRDIEIEQGQIIVSYDDRSLGDPMSAKPTIATTKYIIFDESNLVEVPTSAVGSANP